MDADSRRQGLGFFGNFADGGFEDLLHDVEGDAEVPGERSFDRLADVGIDFEVFGFGVERADLGFVEFLAAELFERFQFLRIEPNLFLASFFSEL
jgi:hypothetical protein